MVMELKILSKKENPLLFRTEVEGEVVFSGATPSYAELKKALSSQVKAGEDAIAVRHIYTAFGKPTARFAAMVYKDAETLKKIEPKVKEKKAKPGQAAEAK